MMSKARELIDHLRNGEAVETRAYGRSMEGRIENGSLVRVRPLVPDEPLLPGDIVLCKVHGHVYLHLIKAVDGDCCLIGNNIGGTNGWTPRREIYGKLDAILE